MPSPVRDQSTAALVLLQAWHRNDEDAIAEVLTWLDPPLRFLPALLRITCTFADELAAARNVTTDRFLTRLLQDR